jgi:hypothetical protein
MSKSSRAIAAQKQALIDESIGADREGDGGRVRVVVAVVVVVDVERFADFIRRFA